LTANRSSIAILSFKQIAMQKLKLKFTREHSFYRNLRKDVYAYFQNQDVQIHANTQMIFKTIFFLCIFFASYGIIVFTSVSSVYKVIACAIHGLSIAAIGFNVSHDCGHNAYFKNKKYNKLLLCTMDLMGSNSYMWDLKHNKAHHIYTNIDSFDEDITGSYLLRLSPHAKFNAVNRFQFIYAWFLYCFIYFYIVWFYNFQQFRLKRFGPFDDLKHPVKEWIKLFAWKLFYFFYAVLFPIWWCGISVGTFLIGYGIVSAVAGFVLGITFYLAHCVEHTAEFPLADQPQLEKNWAIHQMETTCNFAMKNKWVTWFCGGLNYQIEHHLFPEICSVHYPRISALIQRHAAENGIPYLKYGDLSSAVRSHQKMLRRLSAPSFN
jgi:linoleoyl-CoA desaturase